MNARILRLGGPFGGTRILVEASEEQIEGVTSDLEKVAGEATSEDDLVSKATRVILAAGLKVGDVLRPSTSMPTTAGLAAAVMLLAKQRDPIVAWNGVLELFRISELDQVGTLLTEGEFKAQREYLRSLLYTLDEHRDAALRDLAGIVGEPLTYLVAGGVADRL